MDKAAIHMPGDLNRLRRETDMVMATVDSLHKDELAEPALVTGWTRAHVVGHLIGNARALTRLAQWAVTGREQPMYASREARDTEIEELAALSAEELKKTLREANAMFIDAAEKLCAKDLAAPTVTGPLGEISAYAIPAYRISEVLVHHLDLRTLWGLDEADMDALEDALDLAVVRLQGRDDWPGLTIDTDEGEHHVIGDGTTQVRGGRDAILAWLTRGITDGVRSDGELPVPPAFA